MTRTLAYQSLQADVRQFQDTPGHCGTPRDPGFELFAAPPPEIGQVLSADSTLRAGKDGLSPAIRLILIALSAGVGVGFIAWAFQNVSAQMRPGPILAGLVTTGMLPLLTWHFTRFAPKSTFVSREGLYEAKLKGTRGGPIVDRTLLFRDAAELITGQTRHYTNGVYTGTTYEYKWINFQGQPIFGLSGRYRSSKGTPKPGHAFYFGAAGELAWSRHYLERAAEQLDKEGAITFRVDAKRMLRVGPGFMEFHFGGDPQRVTCEDIAKVTLGGGQFSFKHKDAKWYASQGKFNFNYSKMANARVFLLALERLMGYRWS